MILPSSILETILRTAIRFAEDHVESTNEEKRIIFHCRKSLLFYKNEAWKKKDSGSCFDVKMGIFEGGELCEFIGIYLLSLLRTMISKNDCGLYRDDGLMIREYINGQQIDQLRKKIIKTLRKLALKLTLKQI